MFDASEVIEIFFKYDISNSKDESKYEISELDGITNTSYLVNVENDKYVLRIPGNNPDVINRSSEKQNTKKAQECGLTLPYLIFDEDTGVKISKFYDIYTYKSSDFKNENMRKEAFKKLFDLHNSGLVFEKNFSPFNVFNEIADISNSLEKEAREVGFEIVNKIKEIGINNSPCHQDLYSGNFVIYKNQTYLIDWEYSSMGDKFFDYADLFWQNEFDLDKSIRQDALKEIGIHKNDEIEKFEYFEILSMITWGLWALKRSPDDNDGKSSLLKAIKLSVDKKL
tara:strand:+ start:2663 stop:3508 length:846 start_codon:yes stop_codon:yes gene_type:complete